MVRTRHREAWQVRHHSHGYCNACAMRRKRHPKEPEVPTPTLSDFDWHTQAACRGVEPEQFHTAVRGPGVPPDVASAALSHCRVCPVLAQCGEFADRYGYPGLWGGVYRVLRMDGHTKYVEHQLLGEYAESARAVGRHPSARKGAA
jgi:hypothetical protein